MSNFKKYLASLERCREIARLEHQFVTHAFRGCDKVVERLEQAYATVVKRFPKEGNAGASASLAQLQDTLKSSYTTMRAARLINLQAKVEQNDYFNVMLFGRTMSGKSTLREALTGGDGSTIGKGAQRTTLDVKHYEWNELRVVDTPGFGAVEGEDDTKKARETLERVDLVLFLLNSDSIQECAFNELKYIAERNTPLIFVLNMKKNLESEGNRRRALRSPEKVIYKPDEIQGHEERLRFLAGEAGLNPSQVRVIPIHAQAAFLGTQASGLESEELRELGRLDQLLGTICQDVEANGPIRRIQSFLDSALLHVVQQLALFTAQRDRLEKLKPECESGAERIATWRRQLSTSAPKKGRASVDAIYKELEDSIPDFVDANAESSDVADLWKVHVNRLNVQKKIEAAAQSLAMEVREGLQSFSDEMHEGLEFSASLESSPDVGSFDEWDYKRINGWTSAIVGGLGTIAFAMSWNPIGWAAAGISFAFSFFGYLSDSRSSKLSAAKRKMEERLRESVEETKKGCRKALSAWIQSDLLDGMVGFSERRLNSILEGIREFENALEEAQYQIDEVQTDINLRLLQRVATVISGRNNSLPPARRLVRTPGYASYLLTTERFRDIELLRRMGAVLNERIEVIQENSKQDVLMYLFRGLVQYVEVKSIKEAVLYAPAANIGKITGNRGRRIRLAAALTACQLKIQAIKGDKHAGLPLQSTKG